MSKNTQLGNLVNGIYVDSTGKVGVGTQSPVGKFNIVDGTNKSLIFQDSGVADTFEVAAYSASGGTRNLQINAATLLFGTGAAGGSSSTERMRITSGGDILVSNASLTNGAGSRTMSIYGSSGSGGTDISSISLFQIWNGNAYPAIISAQQDSAYGNASSILVFKTSFFSGGINTGERMRITATGNLLIGTTTDNGSRLSVQGAINCLGGAAGLFTQSRNSADLMGWYAENTTYLYYYHTSFGATGRITASSGAYTAISDINKKKNFEQSNIGLNEVMQLKPTLYHLKTDEDSSPKELGFIAQEVKELIPQAYSESEDGNGTFIGLNQMPLIAALTKAIQELSAEITLLKNK